MVVSPDVAADITDVRQTSFLDSTADGYRRFLAAGKRWV
jgi:hypothetical protein